MSEPITLERLAEIEGFIQWQCDWMKECPHARGTGLWKQWQPILEELHCEVERSWARIMDVETKAAEYARLANIGEDSRKHQVEQNNHLQAEVERLRELNRRTQAENNQLYARLGRQGERMMGLE